MASDKPVPCPVCGRKPIVALDCGRYCVACADFSQHQSHHVRVERRTKSLAIAAWNRAYGGRNER